MANHYHARFTGRINLMDLPALRVTVPQLSDQQLTFYMAILKRNDIYDEQRKVVIEEMSSRAVIEYRETFGRCR